MGKRIAVVVDDEKEIRDTLKEVIGMSEYDVVAFEDGQKAISGMESLSDKKAVEVIITDLSMPCVGGLQVIEFAQKKFPEATIILSSACIDPKDEERLRAEGVFILSKPFHVRDLRKMLK